MRVEISNCGDKDQIVKSDQKYLGFFWTLEVSLRLFFS